MGRFRSNRATSERDTLASEVLAGASGTEPKLMAQRLSWLDNLLAW
jgi:hypothetical protein